MDLRDKIRALAREEVNARFFSAKGEVIVYSHIHNYASVEIDDPKQSGKILLELVPVQMTGGVKSAGLKPGDEVWVEFTNGNIMYPKVTAFADRRYAVNTREKQNHKKQGSLIPKRTSKLGSTTKKSVIKKRSKR